MNVTTITVSRDEAQAKLNEYEAQASHERTPADDLLRNVYRAASEGARVINSYAAFRETGLNAQGQPKLAMARADWPRCHFLAGAQGSGAFAARPPWQRGRAERYYLPPGTFTGIHPFLECHSPVPHIPPALRPLPSHLRRYWVLFEVEQWETYPVDPFLLAPLGGPWYRVDGEWELTPLEASLLATLNA